MYQLLKALGNPKEVYVLDGCLIDNHTTSPFSTLHIIYPNELQIKDARDLRSLPYTLTFTLNKTIEESVIQNYTFYIANVINLIINFPFISI